ncbi:hypothetical protein [Dysosmobacter welbionis]
MTFWNAREGGVELVKVNAADKTERLLTPFLESTRHRMTPW